jgi:hypothetical protein
MILLCKYSTVQLYQMLDVILIWSQNTFVVGLENRDNGRKDPPR